MNDRSTRWFLWLQRQLREPAGSFASSDGQLLERFVSQRDEAAFELLLRRHGPMVLRVCRRLLPCSHDAEDAFQGTFLVLARKAGSIGKRDALGPWLHRVAFRLALRQRERLAKTALRETDGADQLAASDLDPLWNELRQVLDEEISRLPELHRRAFVLCCLEGKTGEEAARELNCPAGTVSSRLTRARERLRQRLTRRGLAPAAGPLTVALAGDTLAASLSPDLIAATLKAALLFSMSTAAGPVLSAPAAKLAEGALRAMFIAKLKFVSALVLLVAFLAAGAGMIGPRLHATAMDDAGNANQVRTEKAPKADAKKEGPIAVRVMKPLNGGLGMKVSRPCDVSPYYRVDIKAAVSGQIEKVMVDVGDRVKKGQIMAEIHAPELGLNEKQASVGVQLARSGVQEAESKIATAKTEVQLARSVILQREADLKAAQAIQDFRQKEYERFKKLGEGKAVTADMVAGKLQSLEAARAQAESAKSAIENAKADYEVKRSKVAQAEVALTTAKANLELAHIGLEKAQNALSLTHVTAPFDGVVSRRICNPGSFVQPDGQREFLVTVDRVDKLRLRFNIPDRFASLVQVGDPVQFHFDGLPGEIVTGKVSRISSMLDPNRRTLQVEVDVFNNLKERLLPGMYGEATIEFQKKVAGATVYSSCLVNQGGKSYVFVVRNGKAHRVPVDVRIDDGRQMVISSGLKPTDLVVVNNQEELKDGSAVKVEEEVKPKQ